MRCCRIQETNKREFMGTMDKIDEELGADGGPFFLGAQLSLIDCVFGPMLERIAASIPYYKGFIVRGQGCASKPSPVFALVLHTSSPAPSAHMIPAAQGIIRLEFLHLHRAFMGNALSRCQLYMLGVLFLQ